MSKKSPNPSIREFLWIAVQVWTVHMSGQFQATIQAIIFLLALVFSLNTENYIWYWITVFCTILYTAFRIWESERNKTILYEKDRTPKLDVLYENGSVFRQEKDGKLEIRIGIKNPTDLSIDNLHVELANLRFSDNESINHHKQLVADNTSIEAINSHGVNYYHIMTFTPFDRGNTYLEIAPFDEKGKGTRISWVKICDIKFKISGKNSPEIIPHFLLNISEKKEFNFRLDKIEFHAEIY